MPQYKFVTAVGETGKPAKLTRAIRSHSIRTALRQSGKGDATAAQEEKLKRTATHQAKNSIGPEDSELSGAVVVAKSSALESGGGASIELLPLPLAPWVHVKSIDDGSIDPFNSLPIASSAQNDHLIKYFFSRYDFAAPLDRNRLWFPYAMRSASMMHSTLAMTAGLWRAENVRLDHSILLEGMHHKYEAIRQVRAQLSTHVGVAPRDTDVAFLMSTMSTLVVTEIYDENFEAAQLHLHGVRTLYNSSRHRCNLDADYILCKATGLADMLVAIIMDRQLMFPTMHADLTPPPAPNPPCVIDVSFNGAIAESNSRELFDIFTRLRYALATQHLSATFSEVRQKELNDTDCCILQYRAQERDGLSDIARRNHALARAAQVFLFLTLRHVPAKATIMRRMTNGLQRMVRNTLTNRNIWGEHQQALLWIACMGLLGTQEWAETSSEGRWFLELFGIAATAVAAAAPSVGSCDNNFDSISEIFSSFLWDKAYCQPTVDWLEERQRYCSSKQEATLTQYCPD
ncbi:hypothetical protein PG989_015642 [Apiospora arundinis]